MPRQSGFWRSIAGLTTGFVLIAALLGMAACLKVPLGDSEQASVDHRLDGGWLLPDPTGFWFFRPWDARTWLLTQAGVASDEDACDDEADTDGSEEGATTPSGGADSGAARKTFGGYEPEHAGVCATLIHKAWLTTLGGQVFLVLEPAAVMPPASPEQSDYPFGEFGWWAFRVVWVDADTVRLRMVDTNFSDLDEVTTRAEAERIIASNIDNPALYAESGDDAAAGGASDPRELKRAAPEVNTNLQRLLWKSLGYSG